MSFQDILDLSVAGLTILSLTYALIVGYRRFGLFREGASYLRLGVHASSIDSAESLVLTQIDVTVENLGKTKIDARTEGRSTTGYLYDDGWDRCAHAGTLKIRRISKSTEIQQLTWYELPSLSISSKATQRKKSDDSLPTDFEQINYLDEYQDPETDYREVHFWLEPRECYTLSVFLWLPIGSFAVKAIFLGNLIKHSEEEYWSHSTLISVKKPQSARAAVLAA